MTGGNRGRRSYKLTPDGLARLRASIQRTKPWLRGKGPRSVEGKKRSSMNAFRHGLRSDRVIEIQRGLAELLRLLAMHRSTPDTSR